MSCRWRGQRVSGDPVVSLTFDFELPGERVLLALVGRAQCSSIRSRKRPVLTLGPSRHSTAGVQQSRPEVYEQG